MYIHRMEYHAAIIWRIYRCWQKTISKICCQVNKTIYRTICYIYIVYTNMYTYRLSPNDDTSKTGSAVPKMKKWGGGGHKWGQRKGRPFTEYTILHFKKCLLCARNFFFQCKGDSLSFSTNTLFSWILSDKASVMDKQRSVAVHLPGTYFRLKCHLLLLCLSVQIAMLWNYDLRDSPEYKELQATSLGKHFLIPNLG